MYKWGTTPARTKTQDARNKERQVYDAYKTIRKKDTVADAVIPEVVSYE